MYSTLKRLENKRSHVFSTWNTRGVFVGEKPSVLSLKGYSQVRKNVNAIPSFHNIKSI